MGFKVWYDNRADDLTKEVGVRLKLVAVLLFLPSCNTMYVGRACGRGSLTAVLSFSS